MTLQAVPRAAFQALACLLVLPALAQERPGRTLADAKAALQAGDPVEAARIATERIERHGETELEALWIRALASEGLEDYEQAAQDYRALSRLEASEPRISLRLGEALFKAGDMEASIQAFDAAVRLEPQLAPRLWQRGIAHYYAGRFKDGARQFEIHRRVNPHDVENAVWHFLCVAASRGLDEARAELIPIERDARVPMMEIHALFRGEASAERVLATARAVSSGRPRTRALFYAHLYLALYHEALGNASLSAEHMAEAVARKDSGNYMWQVAKVHRDRRARDQ